MSQYTQRYWRNSLVTTAFAVSLLVGCSSAPVINQVDLSDDTTLDKDSMLPVPEGAAISGVDELDEDSAFSDIYSSFADEMDIPLEGNDANKPQAPPLEYLYSISGGYEASVSDVPMWLTGERFLSFMEPVAITLYNDELYILDAGHQTLFRYEPEGTKLFTLLDLTNYTRGTPSGLTFNDKGYYFISESHQSRILKFNKENLLVDVYEDKSNLANPGKLYFDRKNEKLYVNDEVYSRILIISKSGEFLYTIGRRGQQQAEFVGITDFVAVDDNLLVTDSIGRLPLQVVSNEGGFVNAYGLGDISIPAAIAVSENGTVYVADHDDDSIKIFVDEELRWKVGSSGTRPGKFRLVTQLLIDQDKLYVLDSMNRRVQVFKIK